MADVLLRAIGIPYSMIFTSRYVEARLFAEPSSVSKLGYHARHTLLALERRVLRCKHGRYVGSGSLGNRVHGRGWLGCGRSVVAGRVHRCPTATDFRRRLGIAEDARGTMRRRHSQVVLSSRFVGVESPLRLVIDRRRAGGLDERGFWWSWDVGSPRRSHFTARSRSVVSGSWIIIPSRPGKFSGWRRCRRGDKGRIHRMRYWR
jgi:hypothetical protein